MVGLRTINRTAVFAWSNGSGAPLLVTGTKTGAVNDDFSSETKLELWDLDLGKTEQETELKPAGSITIDSGFNDIAWSETNDEHPLGVIAGALDNGSVDLWDAQKLRDGSSDAFISRTTKHSGAVKALQWNPYRHNLLASAGAKGEIFIYDLNNMSSPFKLGATVARADDIDCLDWNKQDKTAHILATGSSGGFVTVWDVKQKRDILTLNNQGRKAVSAVAWDPEESTKLATATPSDQEPLILMWSLRNSSAPERTLKGHELGVMGMSWCLQDPNLLLSCGKDNKTICWNAKTGESYGEFAAGSNWAFQTKWNPHNPGLIASASFDGKILVTSIQSTNAKKDEQTHAAQALDGEDFFAKAQTQPQDISFSLPIAPRWAGPPVSVSFGFGGKLVRVGKESAKKSKVSIETFSVESNIGQSAQEFEEKLKSNDMASICASKIEGAVTEEEKADWQVMETLNAGKSRKKLREYLGFDSETTDSLATKTGEMTLDGEKASKAETNGEVADDDFFGSGGDGDNFLADLAATKGARTNNPFSIHTDSESAVDKSITRALMLGDFSRALDVCLQDEASDRMADAFMIAVCGGQECIDRAQTAYLKRKAKGDKGPNYLRLLASVVGKNLWDVVHNANLSDWKSVMATLCTYADETEFADLCEALGDRLEEAWQSGSGDQKLLRRDASFCYLAGSKLEKVVINWVQELQEQEKSGIDASDGEENDFAVHARCLQQFVEKVSVFRKVTNFQDPHVQSNEEWKLAPLYHLYTEYADLLAANGLLQNAETYLSLLPASFDGAETAQQRVKQATKKAGAQRQPAVAANVQRAGARMQPQAQTPAPTQPLANQARNSTPGPYAPAAPTPAQPGPYAPAGATGAQGPYAPANNAYAPAGYQPSQGQPGSYGGYQPPQPQTAIPPPPPRAGGAGSPAVPPASAAKNTSNWNDMPDNFLKERQPNSRRGTPGPQPVSSPFPNAPQNMSSPPLTGYGAPGVASPLPPPPKAGEMPQRVISPPSGPPPPRTASAAANAYAPPQRSQPPVGSTLGAPPGPPPVQRGASPYQPPPSTSTAAPSNRYAPAPGSQPSQAPGAPMQMPQQRQVAPNPYGTPSQQPGQYGPPGQQPPPYMQQPQAQPTPPPPRSGPPPQGPPRAQATGPPPAGPPRKPSASPQTPQQPLPQTASDAPAASTPPPSKAKHPRGDRSHIPPTSQPIVDLLSPEIARIKSVAPAQFKQTVDDMEKRINILFDHLNNEELLSEETIGEMVEISRMVAAKEWDGAMSKFTDMHARKFETEGTNWMVGIKRLINIGKATKT